MGKRHREVNAYKWIHGFMDKIPLPVKKMWDRHNFDIGEDRANRNYKREQIAKRDFQLSIKDNTTVNGKQKTGR